MRIDRLIPFLALAALLSASNTVSRADVLWLDDGRRLEGTVTYVSPDRIHIHTARGLVILDADRVRKRDIAPTAYRPIDPAEQERIEKRIAALTQQVTAVERTYLHVGRSSRSERLFEKGRRILLEIDDPLVISPLARVLSDGNVRTRRLLVDLLAGFQDNLATMNLVVIAVLEPDEEVRSAAQMALLSRSDPRVIDDLRAALKSDEDQIVRNAAVALGALKARRAAPDLVDLLSFTRKMTVTIPRGELLSSIQGTYVAGIRYKLAPGVAQAEPIIGTIHQGTAISRQPVRIRTDVTVYRTEVQEALIKITGQNFGFDQEAWRLWLAQNP